MNKEPQIEGLKLYPEEIVLNQRRKKKLSKTSLYIKAGYAEWFTEQLDNLFFDVMTGSLEDKSRKILYPEK